jgi:hypothetical protein
MRRWNFLINGASASTLINASLYDDDPNRYCFRLPFLDEENETFRLLGDGNLLTICDNLHQELAYKIIQNTLTFHTYVILSTSFYAEFELVKNNFT